MRGMGDDGKSGSLMDRILSYGDVAVTQGNVATQTKVVPPPKPAPVPVDVVAIVLIDRRSLISSGLRKAISARLERDLNGLKPEVLKSLALRFETRWESSRPNAQQQGNFGKLDYPLYFEKAHTSDNFTADDVTDTMKAHGIRNAGDAAQLYVQAVAGWQSKQVEGLGIPPLQGYRKVGFIKHDQISDRAKDLETALTNVVKHELGHMLNIKDHASSGLMLASVSMTDAKVTYAEADLKQILKELNRLKQQPEAVLQTQYNNANR